MEPTGFFVQPVHPDEILPSCDAEMVEAIVVRAPRAVVWAAFLAVTPAEMPLASLVARLRTFSLRAPPALTTRTLREAIEKAGWISLYERTEREAIVGLAGRFRRRGFGVVRLASPRDFVEPGAAKVTIRHRFEDVPGGTRIECVTRVKTYGADAERRFQRTGRLLRLGAHLTVRSGLRAIRRRAERTIRH